MGNFLSHDIAHRYACALRCLSNALVALSDDDDRLRKTAAAHWVSRAKAILEVEGRVTAGDHARLAAAGAILEDAATSLAAARNSHREMS